MTRSPARHQIPKTRFDASLSSKVTSLFPPAQGVQGTPTPEGRTKWGTRFGFFTAPRILAAFSSGLSRRGPQLLALRFTEKTRFGAIDLDVTSPHRTLASFAALETAATHRGLRLTLCRSSTSGGWHVYLWANDFVAGTDMHAVLRRVAEEAGIRQLKNGVCEFYPDPHHPRQAFRLPCQAGFAWLSPSDGSVLRECRAEEPEANLRTLLRWVSDVAVPVSAFAGAASAMASPVAEAQMPRGRPPKLVPPPRASAGLPDPGDLALQRALVYRYDRNAAKRGKPPFRRAALARFHEGEYRYRVGLEQPGSRNEALRNVAFYLFFVGYTRPADRELLLVEWLRSRHNGHSVAWLEPAQREGILAEIRRLAVWGPDPSPRQRAAHAVNEATRQAHEKAIAAAARSLSNSGTRITNRRLVEETGLAMNTVARVWPIVRAKIRE